MNKSAVGKQANKVLAGKRIKAKACTYEVETQNGKPLFKTYGVSLTTKPLNRLCGFGYSRAEALRDFKQRNPDLIIV